MGYLFLAIALLAGATKGFCGKKMGNFAETVKSAVSLNIVRMSFCVVFGILLVFAYNDVVYLTLDPKVVAISAFSGISTSAFVVTWLLAVRKSAYMMLDVFLMLGTLVPMVAGYAVFNENISANQWVGFFILVVAVIIMCSYNNSIKTKINIWSFLLLVVCGFVSGLNDFSQKTFVKVLPDVPVSVFNLYTYIFAAVTLLIVYACMSVKNEEKNNKKLGKKYIYVLIMSAALIANSYFKTKAAAHLDSAQLYPLSQGMSLILSSLMAAVFFKEKLTVKCVVGIVIAFAGLIVMNLLSF